MGHSTSANLLPQNMGLVPIMAAELFFRHDYRRNNQWIISPGPISLYGQYCLSQHKAIANTVAESMKLNVW